MASRSTSEATSGESPTESQASRESVWAALLSPQGRYIADMIMFCPASGSPLLRDGPQEGAIFFDLHLDLAKKLLKLLALYRMRADVKLELLEDIKVYSTTNPAPLSAEVSKEMNVLAFCGDPRHKTLGTRFYSTQQLADTSDLAHWTALRIAAGVPQYPQDLFPDKSLLMENRFDELGGIDWEKGCYVGQEVTARMKYRTAAKHTLVSLVKAPETGNAANVQENAAENVELFADSQLTAKIGQLLSSCEDKALALIRRNFSGKTIYAKNQQFQIKPFS